MPPWRSDLQLLLDTDAQKQMGLVALAVTFSFFLGKTPQKICQEKFPSTLPCHSKIYKEKKIYSNLLHKEMCTGYPHKIWLFILCRLLLFPSEDPFSFEKIINIAVPDSFQLQRRVYKGIPDRLRGEVWSRLLNLTKVKNEQEGVYMVSRFASVETSAMH